MKKIFFLVFIIIVLISLSGCIKGEDPIIYVIGDTQMIVSLGSEWEDPGTIVTDFEGEDLVATVSGDIVDVNTAGLYTIYYNAVDSDGNEAIEVFREVTVQDIGVPIITLIGTGSMYWPLGTDWVDPGVTITDDKDEDCEVVVTYNDGEIDTSVLKGYLITYSYTDTDGNEAIKATRYVTIKENTAPVIDLIGDYEITINVDDEWEDPGVTVTDDVDDSLQAWTSTSYIDSSTEGTYIFTYGVTDLNDNEAVRITRVLYVVLDMDSPVIRLVGDENINIVVGGEWEDPGVTITDDIDTDLDVDVSGDTVDTETIGSYIIEYNVTDSDDNEAVTVTRTVNVVSPTETTVYVDITGYTYESLGMVLIDGDTIDFEVGSIAVDPGIQITDMKDEIFIVSFGGINTSSIRTFTITYVLMVSGDILNTVDRTVNIILLS